MVLNPYDEIEYNTRTKTRQMNPWDNEVSYEEVHGIGGIGQSCIIHAFAYIS